MWPVPVTVISMCCTPKTMLSEPKVGPLVDKGRGLWGHGTSVGVSSALRVQVLGMEGSACVRRRSTPSRLQWLRAAGNRQEWANWQEGGQGMPSRGPGGTHTGAGVRPRKGQPEASGGGVPEGPEERLPAPWNLGPALLFATVPPTPLESTCQRV